MSSEDEYSPPVKRQRLRRAASTAAEVSTRPSRAASSAAASSAHVAAAALPVQPAASAAAAPVFLSSKQQMQARLQEIKQRAAAGSQQDRSDEQRANQQFTAATAAPAGDKVRLKATAELANGGQHIDLRDDDDDEDAGQAADESGSDVAMQANGGSDSSSNNNDEGVIVVPETPDGSQGSDLDSLGSDEEYMQPEPSPSPRRTSPARKPPPAPAPAAAQPAAKVSLTLKERWASQGSSKGDGTPPASSQIKRQSSSESLAQLSQTGGSLSQTQSHSLPLSQGSQSGAPASSQGGGTKMQRQLTLTTVSSSSRHRSAAASSSGEQKDASAAEAKSGTSALPYFRRKVSPAKKVYKSLVKGEANAEGDDDDVSIVERKRPHSLTTDAAAAVAGSSKKKKKPKLVTAVPVAVRRPLALTEAATKHSPSSAASHVREIKYVPSGPPSELWVDKYAPTADKDLCVHRKKVQDVRDWIAAWGLPLPPQRGGGGGGGRGFAIAQPTSGPYGHGQRLLILAGPAGSAKSAMVRVLARTMGYGITAWRDPEVEGGGGPFVPASARGSFLDRESAFFRTRQDFSGPYETRTSHFARFLRTSSKYNLDLSDGMAALNVASSGAGDGQVLPSREQRLAAAKDQYEQQAPASVLVTVPTPATISNASASPAPVARPPLQRGVSTAGTWSSSQPSASQPHLKRMFPAGTHCVVVVEELPPLDNEQDRREFGMSMLEAVRNSRFPVILVVTTEHESGGTEFAVEKLLGKEVATDWMVGVITVNPVSATGLRAALQRVADGEGIELPKDVLEQLVQAAKGDVRHAINALQFHAVAHAAANGYAGASAALDAVAAASGSSSAVTSSKGKRKRKSRSALGCSSDSLTAALRDESFSIFHSLGKIVYAKQSETRSVQDVVEASDCRPAKFQEWLFTNYLHGHIDPPRVGHHQVVHPKPAATNLNAQQAGASASRPVDLSSPKKGPSSSVDAGGAKGMGSSFFDDADDMDAEQFDLLMAQAMGGGPKGHVAMPHSAAPHGCFATPSSSSLLLQAKLCWRQAQPGTAQGVLDDEALAAMVCISSAFSDADLLVEASRAGYGDSMHAVEEMQAAEIACTSYMQVKRGLSWSKDEPDDEESAVKKPKQTMRAFQGPLSTKLHFLLQAKHGVFASLFQQSDPDDVGIDLAVLRQPVNSLGRPSQKQAAFLNAMQTFAGRDFLLSSSNMFVDMLPWLHKIASPQPAASAPRIMPSPAPPAPTLATAPSFPPFPPCYGAQQLMHQPMHQSMQQSMAMQHKAPALIRAPMSYPGPPRPPLQLQNFLRPKLNPLQNAFTRLLTTYHERAFLEVLTKEQTAAFDGLAAQIKGFGVPVQRNGYVQAPMMPQAAPIAVPAAGQVEQLLLIEDIED